MQSTASTITQQLIVVADRMAVVIERRGREIAVITREPVLDGAAQRCFDPVPVVTCFVSGRPEALR